MFDDLNDLYQQLIIDHSKSPRNYRKIEGANRTMEGHNPLCGDEVMLYLVVDDNGVIQDISFLGSGCAISKASASILTTVLKGKTVEETKELFQRVRQMVTTGETGEGDIGKLAVFAGVHKYPARVKCAILPWHAALAAVEGKSEKVSTE